MSIIPEQSYPGKIAEASPEYPYGSARNITTPGDGTGTPLEQAWINDDWGFKQALLTAAGITPSGTPDTATDSQYLDALLGITVKTVEDYAALRLAPPSQSFIFARGRDTVGDGAGGYFKWVSGDQSEDVALDTLSGVVVAPDSDPTGASGAWVRLYSGKVQAHWWGAKPDGGTSVRAELQGFIDYLALNGGAGEVAAGTYVVDNGLGLPAGYAGKGFSIDFNYALLDLQRSGDATVISFIAPHNVHLTRLKIKANYSTRGSSGNGVAFSDPISCTVSYTHVEDYRMTAVLFFLSTGALTASDSNLDMTYRDNHIIGCTSDGKGHGRNGMLLVDMHASSIQRCTSRNLDRASSPCVGLQLKNNCRQSMILNSTAESCLAGVAVGGDGTSGGSAGESCLVSNITVNDCLDGLIVSKATNVDFRNIDIDMQGNVANTTGVNIAGLSTGVTVEATVKNIPSSSKAVIMRSSNSYAKIKMPTGLNPETAHFAQFGAGVVGSTIHVEQLKGADGGTNLLGKVEDLANSPTNAVIQPWAYSSSGLTDSTYAYFHTLSGGVASIGYSGSLKTYTFRAGGKQLIYFRKDLFTPASDNVMALGAVGKRWTQVYVAAAAISTSDERLKTDMAEIDAAETRAALKIKKAIRRYKFTDAVDAKGKKARYHFGVGAQTVLKIMESEGLDASEYGFFCFDEFKGGDRYGIRYEELSMFILASI